MHTDASGFAIGAVLQQDQGKGLQPIAFLSKKMLDAETRYPVHEQELLAIIHALSTWRHYLHGRKFTRAAPTTSRCSTSRRSRSCPAASRAGRTSSPNFDFDIEYIEGKSNVVADGLSRRADHQQQLAAARASAIVTRHRHRQRTVHAPAARSDSQLSAATSLLADIHEAHASDAEYRAAAEAASSHPRPTRCRSRAAICTTAAIACTSRTTLRCSTRILQECHDAPLGGHLGKDKTIEQVKRRFYWPGMDDDIAAYVTSCDACQRNKPSQQATMGLLQPLPIPDSSVAAGDAWTSSRSCLAPVPATMPSSCSSTS